MKKLKTKWNLFRDTLAGDIICALIYAIMLLLVLMFFTGNGAFIYEAY